MGKGSSKTQSSNPKWLDDAGAELWNYARNAVFKPADSSAADSSVSLQNPASTTPVTDAWGKPLTSANAGRTTASAAPPAAMSTDNLRPLEQYAGDWVAGSTNNQNRASQFANAFSNSTNPFDRGLSQLDGVGTGFGREFSTNTVDPMMVSSNRWGQQAADQYMNPFVKAALESTSDEMSRQAQIEKLKMNSGMVSKGAFGGSRHGIVESGLNRDLLDRTGAMFKTGMSDAYDKAMAGFTSDEARLLQAGMANQDVRFKADTYNEDNRFRGFESTRDQYNKDNDRLINVAQTRGQLGTARSNAASQDVERLLKTGETQRLINQAKIDANKSRFEQGRDYPYSQLERLASLVNGSASKGSVSTVQQPSAISQIAGAGLSAAAMYSAFSDPELKEDIVKIGEKDGIDIVEFCYKGSKTRYRGVMADQVQKVRPDAVVRRDGYLAVNYAAIGVPFHTVEVSHAQH